MIALFAHLAGFSNFNLCFNKTKKVSFTFSITQTIIAVAKIENTKDLKKQWQFDIILLNSSFLKNYILMFYFHAISIIYTRHILFYFDFRSKLYKNENANLGFDKSRKTSSKQLNMKWWILILFLTNFGQVRVFLDEILITVCCLTKQYYFF